jgi:hypothetical protein
MSNWKTGFKKLCPETHFLSHLAKLKNTFRP